MPIRRSAASLRARLLALGLLALLPVSALMTLHSLDDREHAVADLRQEAQRVA